MRSEADAMTRKTAANVGVVIVSHSSKVAEGAADMVRQMVGGAVPLAFTGGNVDGGLGTDVAAILAAIDRAWIVHAISPCVVELYTSRRCTFQTLHSKTLHPRDKVLVVDMENLFNKVVKSFC